jgi:ABC-type lipoprotein export system ATPase subunit
MAGGLILLDGVWRTYTRGQVVALRDVTLSIERGDYLAITGPSGSGKSTLLYLAGGLDCPTQGRVLFDGSEPKVPARWAALRARRIGFVFQSFHLITGLTAAENVEIAMFGVLRSEQQRKRRVAELLDRVRLNHRRDHRISELSAGESQRVAIAADGRVTACAGPPPIRFFRHPRFSRNNALALNLLLCSGQASVSYNARSAAGRSCQRFLL